MSAPSLQHVVKVTLYLTASSDRWAAEDRPVYLTDKEGACSLFALMRKAGYPISHIEVRDTDGLKLNYKSGYQEYVHDQPPQVQPTISSTNH